MWIAVTPDQDLLSLPKALSGSLVRDSPKSVIYQQSGTAVRSHDWLEEIGLEGLGII